MKKLFKIIVLYIMVFCIFPTINVKAVLTQNADDLISEDVGFALINVRTPDDFDETVYLQLIDEDGNHTICPISSETDYMTEEMIGVGTYRVVSHLDEDLNLPYDVEIVTPIISISADSDAFIEVSVIPVSGSLPESENNSETDSDIGDEDNDSEPVSTDEESAAVSDEDFNDDSSSLGILVTLIATFIILICIVMFIGFVYRHRDE